ncbi:MAG: CdaR family protein [Acutalibacteraceae bacterium]|nr:CdaR family protein [Acutalibacteraceae bacterium]
MQKIKNFFKSFHLRKLLGNKRFTVPFSLGLAFVLWLVITINQNPIIERSFSDMTINVNLENTFASDKGMSIVDDISTQKFTVVVRGASYAVSSITSGDINVYASAASVDAPGEYDLDVMASKTNQLANYEILSVTPSTMKVSFDYIDTKDFTIKPKTEGATAKDGLIAENGIVSGTENDTVTISGPRTVMNKISSVVALAKVNKTLDVSETFDADIVLYDEQGNQISDEHLTLSINKVKVTVPISKTKTVPVLVDFTNLPNGFDKNSISYSLNYSSVTVIGKPETVDKTESVILSPIDLTAVSPTANSFDVSAKLPEGVRLVDNIEYFNVKLNIDNYSQKVITVSDITCNGLGSGLKIQNIAEIKNVRICGPKSVIKNIGSAYAEIDLSGKTAGQHSVEVNISFKENNNVWAIGTYTTTVSIK